jgi:anti-sigma factor RsiW
MNRPSHKDDPADVDLITRYLLGDLPEKQQAEIEDHAFRDADYMKLIQTVEIDLIDEYVRGGLSTRERHQFEARFFASADRRRKVEFAKTLAAVRSEFDPEKDPD